jgi:hypothetical protein
MPKEGGRGLSIIERREAKSLTRLAEQVVKTNEEICNACLFHAGRTGGVPAGIWT